MESLGWRLVTMPEVFSLLLRPPRLLLAPLLDDALAQEGEHDLLASEKPPRPLKGLSDIIGHQRTQLVTAPLALAVHDEQEKEELLAIISHY